MAACCPLLPSGINDEGLLRVRSHPFANPSANDRSLRIGAVHCVVFAQPQSPKRSPAQAIWPNGQTAKSARIL
jgi:hypothetical protein